MNKSKGFLIPITGEIARVDIKSHGILANVSVTIKFPIVLDMDDEMRETVAELVRFCGTGKFLTVSFDGSLADWDDEYVENA